MEYKTVKFVEVGDLTEGGWFMYDYGGCDNFQICRIVGPDHLVDGGEGIVPVFNLSANHADRLDPDELVLPVSGIKGASDGD